MAESTTSSTEARRAFDASETATPTSRTYFWKTMETVFKPCPTVNPTTMTTKKTVTTTARPVSSTVPMMSWNSALGTIRTPSSVNSTPGIDFPKKSTDGKR